MENRPPKYALLAIRQANSTFEDFANSIAAALNQATEHGYDLVWADRKDRAFMAIVARPFGMEDIGGGESAAEVAGGAETEGAVRDLRTEGAESGQMSLPLDLPDRPAVGVSEESLVPNA